MVRLVEVLSFVVGLFFLYRSYRLVKEKKEDVKSFIVWILVGSGLVVLSLNVSMVDYFLAFFNMTSTANLVFTIGILLCLTMIFELFKMTKNIQDQVSKLNDAISISQYKKAKRKKR